MLFFLAASNSSISDRIRSLTSIGEAKTATAPSIVILDIPDKGGYYVDSSDASLPVSERLSAFIDGYFARALERKQLG
jgi:hypothetical protein